MPSQRFSQDSINVLQRRSVGPHWQPRSSHRDIDNSLRFLLDFRKENHCKNEHLEHRRRLQTHWSRIYVLVSELLTVSDAAVRYAVSKSKQYAPYSGTQSSPPKAVAEASLIA